MNLCRDNAEEWLALIRVGPPTIYQNDPMRSATFPAKGECAKEPKGLGRDGNKPLMRNRRAHDCALQMVTAGNTFP